MKSLFSAYRDNYLYDEILTKDKMIVTVDANVLLNLYRYEDSTKNEILSLFKNLKKSGGLNLWLPHHVALEFNTNRKSLLKDNEERLKKISTNFVKFKKEVNSLSTIAGKKGNLQTLKDELGESFDKIQNSIDKHSRLLSKKAGKDKLVDEVFDLFDGIVGAPYSNEKLMLIRDEGNVRFENGVPPGFEDVGKSNVKVHNGQYIESKYGDLVIWFQMIDEARKKNIPLLLISEDVKGDWYSKDFGRVNPELISEFKDKAKQDFFALTVSDFQRHFSKRIKFELSNETTTEIMRVTNSDKGWLGDIVAAFEFYQRPLKLHEVYDYISTNSDRDFPPSWKVIVRRTMYNHCSDLMAYLGKQDLFKKVSSGLYSLR